MKATAATVLAAGMLLPGGSAWALGAAGRCASGELGAVGRHGACRLHANAAVAKIGGARPAFARCDTKFSVKWRRAETQGMHGCPANGDQAAIQAFVAQCTDAVAAALAGGPLLACAGAAGASAAPAPAAARAGHASSHRCESGKLKAGATYWSCRSNADAKAARSGGTVDPSACDSMLAADWGRVE